jgi:hypothetical protein
MRSGASVSQFLQVIVEPVGAEMDFAPRSAGVDDDFFAEGDSPDFAGSLADGGVWDTRHLFKAL